MRILDCQVDWREDVANDPRLEVLVDEIPDRSELRFEQEENIWCAIKDGYASYFSWSGDGNDGGYSGRNFEIETVDGEQVTLKGPWSGRAGVVNKRSFGPVIDVRITEEPDVMENGHTFKSGAITRCAAQQALEHCDETVGLERVVKFDAEEPYWVPTRGEAQ
jgi:hypothetical protein